MNVLQKLLKVTGLANLFEPVIDDEEQSQDTIAWIDRYLCTIVASLQNDIMMEQQGSYVCLQDKHSRPTEKPESLGYIQYLVKDEQGKRLALSQFSLVSRNSIKMTASYQLLKAFTDSNNYTIELKEINIDANGEDSFDALDAHLAEFERYFVIIISGW